MELKEITELIEQQDAVEESLDMNFGLHAEFSPLGIMVLDAKGVIILANPTSTKLFGWVDGQSTLVEGRNIFDMSIIKDDPKAQDGIKKLLKGQPLVENEVRINTGLSTKVMKMYGSPRFTVNDNLDGAILTYADVTDLIHAQEELQHQKNELSELASVMRHDLMNYLHNIIGFVEVLELGPSNEYIERIIQNANHIKNVFNRSHELAEAGKIIEKKEEVDIGKLVDKLAEMIIPKSIRFNRTNLPVLLCDEAKVIQIFHNLFKNAVIHGNPSLIEVEFVTSTITSNRITVRNDGNLIPEEDRDKVFDRGFTSSDQGSGLGLYITKKLCIAHQWDILLEVTDVTMFHIDISEPFGLFS